MTEFKTCWNLCFFSAAQLGLQRLSSVCLLHGWYSHGFQWTLCPQGGSQLPVGRLHWEDPLSPPWHCRCQFEHKPDIQTLYTMFVRIPMLLLLFLSALVEHSPRTWSLLRTTQMKWLTSWGITLPCTMQCTQCTSAPWWFGPTWTMSSPPSQWTKWQLQMATMKCSS